MRWCVIASFPFARHARAVHVLGVSGKSVVLYALVFTCRYLDLFVNFISVYNSVMKVVYLATTYFTVYLIYVKFRSTYHRSQDTFRIELLILPAAALAFLWNHEFTVLEVGPVRELRQSLPLLI